MGYLGSAVGGALAVILLGLLVGLAFKTKPPVERAMIASFAAFLIAGAIAGFGMANGGDYRFDAILNYIPGAIIGFFYLRWHYGKDWIEDEA